MFDLSDDDSFSTQLEGKKLKDRGARMDSSFIDAPQLEIDKDAPGLMGEVEIEKEREFFTDRSEGKENEEERGERLKKERLSARKAQLELRQTKQQRTDQKIDDPNLKLDEIEQGVLQSQNKGEKTIETQFKQHEETKESSDRARSSKEEPLRKTDVVAASALLGPDNIKNLNLDDDKKLAEKSSVPAKNLPDVRGKEGGLQI